MLRFDAFMPQLVLMTDDDANRAERSVVGSASRLTLPHHDLLASSFGGLGLRWQIHPQVASPHSSPIIFE